MLDRIDSVNGAPVFWGLSRTTLALSIAGGVLIGIVYSASPLTLIWGLWMLLFIRRAGRNFADRERQWLRGLLVAAIALRAAVLGVLLLTTGRDSQSAGILFGDEGYIVRRAWRLRNAWLGFPGAPYDYINAFEEYGRSGYLYVISYLQVLFGPASYSIRLLNAGLFVTTAYVLYRLARRAYGGVPALIGLAVLLFLPTQFSWSISLLKESAYLLATAGVLVAVVNAVRSSRWRQRAKWSIAAIIFVALIWPLRPQGIAIVVAALAMGFALWWTTCRVRRALVVAVALPVVVLLLLQQPRIYAQTLELLQNAAHEHGGHTFTIGHAYKTLDQQFYTVPTFLAWKLTPQQAGRFVIRSAAAYLLVPLPWQAISRSEILYLPEQMLWYLLALLAFGGVFVAFRRDSLVTCLLVSYVFVNSAAVALTSGNVGTLIRHRSLTIPFLVWFSALALVWLLERVIAAAALPSASKSLRKGTNEPCPS